MDSIFDSTSNFASLSLKDLMEARQLFHYHLINKKNVVATALGLYRIRKGDPWPTGHEPKPRARSRHSERRTLFNSEIRPYSWPCVYVFVSEWADEAHLAADRPSDVVPKTLYLPDGRTVPVCVIEAKKQDIEKDLRVDVGALTPRNLLGPGTPILNDDGQGVTRIATAGCIVRDGQRYYVLTNQHAAGDPGTRVEALQVHRTPTIGTSATKALGRVDFKTIYPGFASTNQRLLMDVGLIDLDDITQWKTDVPGISPLGPVLDLYDNSLTLKLIGMSVVGYSAISGLIRGEIQGLFYRFKSLGGSEYISDFLIGPESGPAVHARRKEAASENVAFNVRHGDSGTLLFIEHEEKPLTGAERAGPGKKIYRPFALLWGKEEFLQDGKTLSHPFGLAASLSPILDQLNLDVVYGFNRDQEYIWGWVGHYLIGGTLPLIPDLLGSAALESFIKKNIALLTVPLDQKLDNDPRVVATDGSNAAHPAFVPLADVPDNVWKSNVNFYQTGGSDGGRHRHPGPGSRGQDDNPNHFADMDLPYENYDTFLDFELAWIAEPPDPNDWIAYFKAHEQDYEKWEEALAPNKKPRPVSSHWGALPFRIWQLFDVMVAAASGGKQDEFLTAGGVLIHYVGDACQPLHTSYLSQGDPTRVVKRPKSAGFILEANNVHSGYEDEMVNYGYTDQNLEEKVNDAISAQQADGGEEIEDMHKGADAARAIIRLIDATHKTIEPREIVDKWVEVKGLNKGQREQAMWQAFGLRTAQCMARGSRYLAKMWGDAWAAGNGDRKIGKGSARKPANIMALYNNSKFIPSVRLDQYARILKR